MSNIVVLFKIDVGNRDNVDGFKALRIFDFPEISWGVSANGNTIRLHRVIKGSIPLLSTI